MIWRTIKLVLPATSTVPINKAMTMAIPSSPFATVRCFDVLALLGKVWLVMA